MRFLSRAFFSIFVSLSDSHGSNGSFCEFFFAWVLCNFLQISLSSFLKPWLKRLILLSYVRKVFLVFLMICFRRCFPASDTEFFTQVKSVRGLLPECITTRSLLPFGGLSASSPSASISCRSVLDSRRHLSSDIPIVHFLPVCIRGVLDVSFTDTHFPRCVFRYAISSHLT